MGRGREGEASDEKSGYKEERKKMERRKNSCESGRVFNGEMERGKLEKWNTVEKWKNV